MKADGSRAGVTFELANNGGERYQIGELLRLKSDSWVGGELRRVPDESRHGPFSRPTFQLATMGETAVGFAAI